MSASTWREKKHGKAYSLIRWSCASFWLWLFSLIDPNLSARCWWCQWWWWLYETAVNTQKVHQDSFIKERGNQAWEFLIRILPFVHKRSECRVAYRTTFQTLQHFAHGRAGEGREGNAAMTSMFTPSYRSRWLLLNTGKQESRYTMQCSCAHVKMRSSCHLVGATTHQTHKQSHPHQQTHRAVK